MGFSLKNIFKKEPVAEPPQTYGPKIKPLKGPDGKFVSKKTARPRSHLETATIYGSPIRYFKISGQWLFCIEDVIAAAAVTNIADCIKNLKKLQGLKKIWLKTVEVEVEKELGLHNKKEIEELVLGDEFKSLEKFINLCKERVKKYSSIQTEQSKRLGYFMNWDNSYHTSSDENNYAIWNFLKVVKEKG